MGTQRPTGEPSHNVEGIRAQKVAGLFNKLSLSVEQTEAIENLSRSLIDKLVDGPIAGTVALGHEPRESLASGDTSHGRREA